jgi:hypothetical protein
MMRWIGYVERMGEKRNECIYDFDGKARRKETTWKA